MGEYEPITKELREYLTNLVMSDQTKGKLRDLCDNIDAIHRSLEAENERLRDASERVDDWIKLPVDADDVPVREGDELWSDNGVLVKVKWLEYENDKWAVFVENKVGISFYAIVEDMRHYRPDTWESIIEDATKLGAQMGRRTTQVDDLVARCKALAGDAE